MSHSVVQKVQKLEVFPLNKVNLGDFITFGYSSLQLKEQLLNY